MLDVQNKQLQSKLQDFEMEREFLSYLIHSDRVDQLNAIEKVSPSYFSNKEYLEIYDLIAKIVDEGRPVNPYSIRTDFSTRIPEFRKAILEEYLENAIQGEVYHDIENLSYYLKEMYRNRVLINGLESAKHKFVAGDSLDDIINDLSKCIISSEKNANKEKSMKDIRDKLIKSILYKEEASKGLYIGLDQFDKEFGGIKPDQNWVIAADSSVGKCLAKGTKVIMYNGSMKNVEDIKPGDQLMGPDSTPRNVFSTCVGREMMYWVRQEKGIDYRVNESHILSFRDESDEIINVPLKEYLANIYNNDRYSLRLLGWKSKPSGIEYSRVIVKKDKVDDYYGFTIDGDHLFLLEDFTVTHNTAAAIDIAYRLGTKHTDKIAMLYVSLEMSEERVMKRMVSRDTGLTNSVLEDRFDKRPKDYDGLIFDSIMKVTEMPLTIVYQSLNNQKLRNRVRRFALENKGKHLIIFLDYIGLVEGDVSAIRNLIIETANTMKSFNIDYNATTFTLSQLKKEVSSPERARTFHRPYQSDIMESGAIYNNADNVILLWRPEKYGMQTIAFDNNPEWDCRNRIIFENIKNRDGQTPTSQVYECNIATNYIANDSSPFA